MTLEPAERMAEARKAAIRLVDSICPNVVGNPFVPHWPYPQQIKFLGLHMDSPGDRVFEALYGGAVGGGKSDALLMAAAQYAWKEPGFSGILFRRTYQDLAKPGALLSRAKEWWIPAGVRYNDNTKQFTFPSGAKVVMAYCAGPNDHLNYAGGEYQLTGWDELTQWPNDSQYEFVGISRVRRTIDSAIPLRTLSTANPGGPGHVWVRNRFMGGPHEETGEYVPPQHPFVPASIYDNPALDRDTYIAGLEHLHPTLREQLLHGDWSAKEPGDYFRADWFGPLLDPEADTWPSRDCLRVRWWDLAASEKKTAARTSGVRMARHRSGVRAVEHVVSFRLTPGARDDRIVQVAQADGPSVTVGIEIEPGSGGLAQFEALQRRLQSHGIRAVGARPGDMSDREAAVMFRTPSGMVGKAARAVPVASCLERGHQRRGECPDTGASWWGVDRDLPPTHQRDGIRLFSGPWVTSFLDVIEMFPDGPTCDEVDAMTGAWSYLEAHSFGFQQPLPRESQPKASGSDARQVHPADRPKRSDGRDAGGRWTPG